MRANKGNSVQNEGEGAEPPNALVPPTTSRRYARLATLTRGAQAQRPRRPETSVNEPCAVAKPSHRRQAQTKQPVNEPGRRFGDGVAAVLVAWKRAVVVVVPPMTNPRVKQTTTRALRQIVPAR